MNARQKAKNLKRKVNDLKSDNDLMRSIIANSPAMQELYDAYNKPVNITHTTIHCDEYRSKMFLSPQTSYDAAIIEMLKRELANNLFEGIKNNITYDVDTECMAPTITASIFIGRK